MRHEATIFNVGMDETLHITRVCAGSIITMAGRTDRRRITRLRDRGSCCLIRNVFYGDRGLNWPKMNVVFFLKQIGQRYQGLMTDDIIDQING